MAKRVDEKKTETSQKVSDIITVDMIIDGTSTAKTIKMSMGLIQNLFSKFTVQDQIYNLGLDFNMQKELMNEVLDSRDQNGDRENPEKDWSMYLSLEEGEKLVSWISEHIINFFTSKLESQKKAVEKLLPVLQEVNAALEKIPAEDKESNPA